jgi:hypothetical protein
MQVLQADSTTASDESTISARVNVPFLQDGGAEGDVVRFITDDDGLLWVL